MGGLLGDIQVRFIRLRVLLQKCIKSLVDCGRFNLINCLRKELN